MKNVITSTFDIIDVIKKYSLKYKVALKYVDFKILDITYIYKTSSSNRIIKQDDIFKINNDGNILQKFKIELFKKDKVKFIINHKMAFSKDKTKSFSIISTKSKINYYDNLRNDLIEYFNKEKAKRKIMIYVFDDEMVNDISLFTDIIKHKKRLSKQVKITMSSKCSYISSKENDLSYKYLPKNMGKNDLSNCYCFVKKGQQVISYVKGCKGVSGINIYGNYIKAKEIRIKEDLSFNLSKNLKITNNDDSSEVIANIDGVLVFKNEEFDIQHNLSFNSLDFRAVRYFNIPLDIEDITINVSSKVEFENAISPRTILKAHNINIKGDIGEKSTIVAVNLTCTGNIHHSTILRAKNADLKILKGKLKAENAKIKNIENGLVIADKVEVDTMLGGEIRAKEIKIILLYSNNKIKCSNILEISRVKGESNTIYASMMIDLEIKKEILRYQDELSQVKEIPDKDIPIIKKKYKEYEKKAQILEAKLQKESFNTIELQKHIMLNKNVLDALHKDIEALKYKNTLISNLKKIDTLLYQTKITLSNGFNGDNIIVYDYAHKKESIRATISQYIKYISLESEDNQDYIKLS